MIASCSQCPTARVPLDFAPIGRWSELSVISDSQVQQSPHSTSGTSKFLARSCTARSSSLESQLSPEPLAVHQGQT